MDRGEPSMGSQWVEHDWATHTHTPARKAGRGNGILQDPYQLLNFLLWFGGDGREEQQARIPWQRNPSSPWLEVGGKSEDHRGWPRLGLHSPFACPHSALLPSKSETCHPFPRRGGEKQDFVSHRLFPFIYYNWVAGGNPHYLMSWLWRLSEEEAGTLLCVGRQGCLAPLQRGVRDRECRSEWERARCWEPRGCMSIWWMRLCPELWAGVPRWRRRQGLSCVKGQCVRPVRGAWGVGAVGSGQPLRPEEEEAWTASGDEGPLLSIKRAMVRGVRGWLRLQAKSKTVPVYCLMAGKLLTGYYGLNVISPHNSHFEALTSDMIIFGDGSFGDS